jgi:hypothetical protein
MTRALALVALLTLVLRRQLVVITVRGNSMHPTYADGDTLLALRTRTFRRGRAIVFTPPASLDPDAPPYRVKRVIAVAGDPTPEWVHAATPGAPVPPGRVVVRGDNPASEDSRAYGYVSNAGVLGVVVRRLQSSKQD